MLVVLNGAPNWVAVLTSAVKVMLEPASAPTGMVTLNGATGAVRLPVASKARFVSGWVGNSVPSAEPYTAQLLAEVLA